MASWTYGVIAIVSAVGVGASLGKSIWVDEGASIYSAHLSWHGLWEQSHVIDRVFLPYYALLHVWVLANSSIEWARVPSLLVYALTVFLIGRLGRRFGGYWCGVIAAVLCASNPLMIQEALDARPYLLTALTATVSVLFLVRWIEGNETRWLWWFSIAAIATLALQEFAVLAPLAALAGVIAFRPKVVRERFWHLLWPVGLLLAVSAVFAALTADQRSQIGWIHAFNSSSFLVSFYGPVGADSHTGRIIYALVVVGILALVLTTSFTSRSRLRSVLSRQDLEPLTLALFWAALPTALLIAASFFVPIFANRYVTDSAPGLALGLALLVTYSLKLRPVEARSPSLWVRAGAGAAVVLLVLTVVVVSRFEVEQVKQGAHYLEGHVGRSSVVAYPDPLAATEFETYLSPPRVHDATWPRVPVQSFQYLDLRHTSSEFAAAPTNVWIAADSSSDTATGRFVAMLKRHGYVRVDYREFPGGFPVYIEHFRR
jgi:hypothetical protein